MRQQKCLQLTVRKVMGYRKNHADKYKRPWSGRRGLSRKKKFKRLYFLVYIDYFYIEKSYFTFVFHKIFHKKIVNYRRSHRASKKNANSDDSHEANVSNTLINDDSDFPNPIPISTDISEFNTLPECMASSKRKKKSDKAIETELFSNAVDLSDAALSTYSKTLSKKELHHILDIPEDEDPLNQKFKQFSPTKFINFVRDTKLSLKRLRQIIFR